MSKYRTKRRALHATLLIAAASLVLAACGSSGSGNTAQTGASSGTQSAGAGAASQPAGPAPGGSQSSAPASGAASQSWAGLTFDYANSSTSGVVFTTIRQSMVDAAKSLGTNLKVYENNGDGPTAINNAKLMAQDKPKVIIEYNLVQGVGASLGAQFKQSNIPCVSVNVEVPGCPFINISNTESGVGAGQIIAKAALAKGWSAANTTVLVAQCSTCGADINNSPRWFYLTVAKAMGMPVYDPSKISATTTTLGPNLYQVDDPTLSIDKTYAAVQRALQTIPKDRHLLVFAVNDDQSIGAWRAISAAGRQGNTLIGGLSGLPEGLDQLRTNPQWVAEGSLFLHHWGQYVMALAVAVKDGMKTPPLTPFPQITMDKQTVNKYFPNGANVAALLPPLTPENEYLAKTGVLQAFNNVEGLKK